MSLLARPKKKPSDRNIEIYYAVVADERTRVEVAADNKITTQRVSAIVKHVSRWLLKKAVEDGPTPAQQSFLAHDAHLHSLKKFKVQAIAAFEQTCKPQEAPNVAEGKPGRWYPARPDARLLAKAMDAASEFVAVTESRGKVQDRLIGEKKAAEARLLEEQKQDENWWQERERKLVAKEKREKAERKQRRALRAELAAEAVADAASVGSRDVGSTQHGSLGHESATTTQPTLAASATVADTASIGSQDVGSADNGSLGHESATPPTLVASATVELPPGVGTHENLPEPPAGAMFLADENDPEGQPITKNAAGETIWLFETYDYGPNLNRPIESADGNCFSGFIAWRTEAEIEDEFRRRMAK